MIVLRGQLYGFIGDGPSPFDFANLQLTGKIWPESGLVGVVKGDILVAPAPPFHVANVSHDRAGRAVARCV